MYNLKFEENDDVIFTSYFSSKNNPQPNADGIFSAVPSNNISYVFPWYATICHLNLNGVIIHDGLSEAFISQYSRENIQFIYHPVNKYSLNDERFIALKNILERNTLRKALLTDGSDLIIKRNPFEFMNNAGTLYCGSDELTKPRVRDNPWCVNKLIKFMENSTPEIVVSESFLNFEYVNAGVVGGSFNIIKNVCTVLTNIFDILNSEDNNNMIALNYLLWKYDVPHFKGLPFTSPFKKFELYGDYYIVHK